jgi:hypothetical protein
MVFGLLLRVQDYSKERLCRVFEGPKVLTHDARLLQISRQRRRQPVAVRAGRSTLDNCDITAVAIQLDQLQDH